MNQYIPLETSNLTYHQAPYNSDHPYKMDVGLGARSRAKKCYQLYHTPNMCYGLFEDGNTKFASTYDHNISCMTSENYVTGIQVARLPGATNKMTIL